MGDGSGTSRARYNPVTDDLSKGGIVEDMIPRDPRALTRLLRLIYARDSVCGPGVDILKELLHSDFELTKVRDPRARQVYEEAKEASRLAFKIPELAGEYLQIGRVASSLLFNGAKGIWDGILVHNPDYLEITPIPVEGYDPKIDLIPPPEMTRFVRSRDPRDLKARERLAPETVRLILSGRQIPLNPDNTSYLCRKGYPNDQFGMSLYSRAFPFIAIEKALTNGTVSAVRRWVGPRIHVKAGIPDQWDPTSAELEDLTDLLMRAEEDPVGSITATRLGVEIQEWGSSGKGQFWSLDDSFEMLHLGKMRAIGMHAAMLDGEATFSNAEHAKSFFIERVKALRTYFRDAFIVGKFYKVLAEAHGFYRRTTAELAHRVRTTSQTEESLDLPDIDWHKRLDLEGDTVMLDILKVIEQNGGPVPIRLWYALGGVDFDKSMSMLDADIKDRQIIDKWRSKVKLIGEPTGDPHEMETSEGQQLNELDPDRNLPRAQDIPTIHANIAALPVWQDGQFTSALTLREANQLASDVVQKPALRNGHLGTYLEQKGWTKGKRELVGYVLGRAGVSAPCFLGEETFDDMARWICGGSQLNAEGLIELQRAARYVRRKTDIKMAAEAIRSSMAGLRVSSGANGFVGCQ